MFPTSYGRIKVKRPGKFVEHISHEACGSSDGLAVYSHKDKPDDGYCWSCNTYVTHPYDEGEPIVMGLKRSKVSIEEINQYPVLALDQRGITKETAEYFGVRVGVDSSTGSEVVEHYYPSTKNGSVTGYKKRTVDTKVFSAIGVTKDCDMFGYRQAQEAGGKKLWITEGECDAMALYQTLRKFSGEKWQHHHPAVVSITKGAAGAVSSISKNLQFVNRFEQVILVFD